MNYSRRQLEFLGEPFGDSCTRVEGGRTIYGSGGGGQAQRDATEEERRLWGAQARALEQMQSISMPMLQTGMNNLGVLANESMDGSLAERLRGMAGSDASAAMGQALTGANQKLERFGSTMNPNALGAQMNNVALMGAANKANAMNQANMAAEDVKWQRNAALAGLSSGQGAQAVSGLGSLASQIGQNRQAGNAAGAQSMQGYGMMGAMLGNGLFGADGGYAYDPAPRFASGGGLQMYRPMSMATMNPMQFGNSTDTDSPSAGQVLGAIAQPVAMAAAADLAKSTLKDMGITPAIEKGWAGVKNSVGSMFKPGVQPGATMVEGATPEMVQGLSQGLGQGVGVSEGAGMLAPVAEGASLGGAGGVGGAALAEGASLGGAALGGASGASLGGAALAEGAGMLAPVWGGGAAATGAAGALGAAGTANAWNPVGWGLLAAAAISALSNRASGGPIGRMDVRRGGPVDGPGTETSDSIPAWLSDGEYVVNAESMKDPEDARKVEQINEKGLKKRRRRGKRGSGATKKVNGKAGGGLMRDLAHGPGTLTMGLTGGDTSNLSDVQMLASVLGDPIGAKVFASGGGVGLRAKRC